MPLVTEQAVRRKSKRTSTAPIANPLRADPTRTTTLRRMFVHALRGRLKSLQRSILGLVVVEDAFGLSQPKPLDVSRLVGNNRFRFHSSPQKIAIFQAWLQQQIKGQVLAGELEQAENAYWNRYVEDAYKKGQGRAYDDFMKKQRKFGAHEGDFYRGTKAQFLQSSFGRPVAIEKVKLLSSRVYTELKGVTDDMAKKMTRHLTDGIAQGMSPREVGKKMADDITGVGKLNARQRADMIARTETIRSHAEGQLDALEDLGVSELGVMVEWSVAGDRRTCPLCASLEGVTVKMKEARGMIPRHPNCRCSWIPAGVGESDPNQKTGKRAQRAIDQSIGKERSEKAKKAGVTIKQQKAKSTWTGADTKLTKPLKGILD